VNQDLTSPWPVPVLRGDPCSFLGVKLSLNYILCNVSLLILLLLLQYCVLHNEYMWQWAGSTYLYTTYGWTLVSAVIEGATGKQFPAIMKQLFTDLGLERTQLELETPLVYGRSRCVNIRARLFIFIFILSIYI